MIQKALITLDISGEAAGQRITAKQGDKNTRTIQAQIVDGGVPANFESGVTAEFVCHKPDHTQVVMDTGFTGSVVTVTLSDQCLTRAGNCRCEFRFKKSDQVLSTVTFLLVVYPSAFDQNAFESSDDYKGLDEATQEAKEAADAANTAAEDAEEKAQEAQEAAQKADAAAERAQQAAEGIENFWDRADTRYANAITGSGAGASVSCPQIWTGASLVSAEIQGHTVEQGEGEKGPYNPYRFVGVAPTKITLAGTEQSEEAALPEIAPLHSLPTGIHDTYDPATGIETRRAGMQVITGSGIGEWSVLSSSDRICIDQACERSAKWSGETVQRDEHTAHGINAVDFGLHLSVWIDFLRGGGRTRIPRLRTRPGCISSRRRCEAGTPVTVTYPLKEPEITQHDPIAMRPPQSPATVSADQGELSVTYVKDTNEAIKDPGGVIDRAEAAAEAAEQAAGRANGVIDGAQERRRLRQRDGRLRPRPGPAAPKRGGDPGGRNVAAGGTHQRHHLFCCPGRWLHPDRGSHRRTFLPSYQRGGSGGIGSGGDHREILQPIGYAGNRHPEPAGADGSGGQDQGRPAKNGGDQRPIQGSCRCAGRGHQYRCGIHGCSGQIQTGFPWDCQNDYILSCVYRRDNIPLHGNDVAFWGSGPSANLHQAHHRVQPGQCYRLKRCSVVSPHIPWRLAQTVCGIFRRLSDRWNPCGVPRLTGYLHHAQQGRCGLHVHMLADTD